MIFSFNLSAPNKIYAVAWQDITNPEYVGIDFKNYETGLLFFSLEEAKSHANKMAERRITKILEWSYNGIVLDNKYA